MSDPSAFWFGPRLPPMGPLFGGSAATSAVRMDSKQEATALDLTTAYQTIGTVVAQLADPSAARKYEAQIHFPVAGGSTTTMTVFAAIQVRYNGAGAWTTVKEVENLLPRTADLAPENFEGAYAYCDMAFELGSAITPAMPDPCTLVEFRGQAKLSAQGDPDTGAASIVDSRGQSYFIKCTELRA